MTSTPREYNAPAHVQTGTQTNPTSHRITSPWEAADCKIRGPKFIPVKQEDGVGVYVYYVSVHNNDLPTITPPPRDPYQHPWDAMKIRWAADSTIWLAWYSPSPSFDGMLSSLRLKGSSLPIEPVAQTPGGNDWTGRYHLQPAVAYQWNTIAQMMATLSDILTRFSSRTQMTLPPLEDPGVPRWDNRRVFQHYDSRRKARNAMDYSRMILIVWMTHVSFLASLRPDVPDILASHLDGSWINTISRSWIMDRNAPRVGIYVNATAPYAQWMSILPHMLAYSGMPIWIFYGSQPLLRYAHELLHLYLPRKHDVEAVQRAQDVSSRNPHHAATSSSTPSLPMATRRPSPPFVLDPDAPVPGADSRQKQGQTPVQFFEEQRLARIKLMNRETSAQRRLREEREARENALVQPIAKGPAVFIWEEIEHNGKVYWMRNYCGVSRRNKEVWPSTSRAMRVYHSVIHEWDVWSGLDPDWTALDEDDEDEMMPGIYEQESHDSNTYPVQPVSIQPQTPPSLGDSLATSSAQRPLGPPRVHQDENAIYAPQRRDNSAAPCTSRPRQSRSASPARRGPTGSQLTPGHRSRSPIRASASRPSSDHPSELSTSLLFTQVEMEELYQDQYAEGRLRTPRLVVDPITEVFRYRYGFRVDPEYAPTPSSSPKVKKESLWILWSFHKERDPLPSEWIPYCLDFSSRLLQSEEIPAQLSSVASSPLQTPQLPRYQGPVQQSVLTQADSSPHSLYAIPGCGSDDFPWMLSTPSATTAAEILVRGWGPTKRIIVFELLKRGMPFSMMLPASPLAQAVVEHAALPSVGIRGGLGWRLPGFRVGKLDYLLYEQYCGAFLRQHAHARVGLAQGGIIWRLCMQYLDEELILDGPVGDSVHQRQVIVSDQSYVEDFLSESEQDLICGVYKILNGPRHPKNSYWQPSNTTTAQDYSWWPKQSIWLESGAHFGYWTSANEEWFQNRLERVRAGGAPPVSSTQWRQNLKYQKATTKVLLSKVEAFCAGSL